MLGYIIVGSSFFILYTLIRFTILKTLVKLGKTNVSISSVNFISAFASITIIIIPVYMWINSAFETDKFEISNFKFEKSVLLKSPDFLDESKTDENLYIYYSFDIKNTDSDIKNFKLHNFLELMNFNNMGDFKELVFSTSFYDNEKKIKKFDDINLFKQNETIKGYGFIDLDNEKIKWITDKIPFQPEIKFKVGGGTATDEFKYGIQEIEHNIDLSKFQEDVINSYKDPKTITLEYHKKNKYSMTSLKKNIWSEKRKKRGKRETDAINPDEILEYLFID